MKLCLEKSITTVNTDHPDIASQLFRVTGSIWSTKNYAQVFKFRGEQRGIEKVNWDKENT